MNSAKIIESSHFVDETPDVDTNSSNFRLSGTRYMLTYRTHLPKDDVEIIFGRLSNSGIKFIRCAHELGHSDNDYEHTHVLVHFNAKITSRNPRFFDWVYPSTETTTEVIIHPHIKVVRDNTHFNHCKKYLAKEDLDNQDLLGNEELSLFEKVSACKNKQEALQKYCTTPTQASGILTLFNAKYNINHASPDDFVRWQWTKWNELIATFDFQPFFLPNVDEIRVGDTEWKFPSGFDRKMEIIWNPDGNCGKTVFIKKLLAIDPTRFFALQGVATRRDMGTIIQNALANGWTGHTLLINLAKGHVDHKIYEVLESLRDGLITAEKYVGGTLTWNPVNLIIFCNRMPNVESLTSDRWVIRGINIFNQNLFNIDYKSARDIYRTELDELQCDTQSISEFIINTNKPVSKVDKSNKIKSILDKMDKNDV